MTRTSGRRDMRRSDRRPAELAVLVRYAGRSVPGGLRLDAHDLSEGGAFLRSDVLLEVGQEVDLEIALGFGGKIRAGARVAHVARGGKDTAGGMGLEFTSISPADRRALLAAAQPARAERRS